jgi:putative endonuclease
VRTYHVYLLRCFDGTFYTGVTNDVDRRYCEHCHGDKKDSYTYTRRPLRLVYTGEFESIHEAIAFEKKLKSWRHAKNDSLLKNAPVGGVALTNVLDFLASLNCALHGAPFGMT